jgi:hypothetical protein
VPFRVLPKCKHFAKNSLAISTMGKNKSEACGKLHALLLCFAFSSGKYNFRKVFGKTRNGKNLRRTLYVDR